MKTIMEVCRDPTSRLQSAPAVTIATQADAPTLPMVDLVGRIETVATFDGPMPTGVTVSRKGRIFVNFPRWGDPVTFTVAELKDGKPVAYPDATFNTLDKDRPAECARVGAERRGGPRRPAVDARHRQHRVRPDRCPGGPKLVCVDLATNKVFKTIRFPPDVALKTTYLNDVRFDLRRGKAGVAFITDSSAEGPNGIIVVDLTAARAGGGCTTTRPRRRTRTSCRSSRAGRS